MSLNAGTRLGPYEILGTLGAGGMGEVYRARDTRLRRDIAIKVLPRSVAQDPDRRLRLFREARAAASLNHPNICTIHEVNEADGDVYIAMELVEGQPLGRRLTAGALSTGDVIRYGLQVAEALAHAHDRGVVHRDLKSVNVMVTPDGRAKVVDFGLAGRDRSDVTNVEAPTETELTEPGVAGTFPYMAPEQLRGHPGDMRSDVWSLGVLLYEMAAGAKPFRGTTMFEVSSAILTQAPPPLPSLVPAAVRSIILRCLEKDPGRRYQRGAEVAAALESASLGTAASSPSRRTFGPRTRHTTLLAAAVAVAIAGVWWWPAARMLSRQRTPHAIRSVAVLPMENLSHNPSQDFFADGMTEALIVNLAKISALRVPSRTSVMHYRMTDKTLQEIARELGVDALVEGSAQLEGQHVRVTAQLIEANSDRHLWADSYERDLKDVLAMQAELARSISSAIRAQLTTQEQERLATSRPVDPDAHLLYLQGRYQLNRRAEGNIEKARAFFQQAIDKDPTNAAAYEGLADSYYLLFDYPRMKAAALKALELDPDLADAHASIGLVRTYYDWDWTGAESELRRATELNPGSATVHHYYAHYLMAMRRFDASLEESQRARELDPLNPLMAEHMAFHYHFARQYDQALPHLQRLLDMEPALALGHLRFGLTFEQKGMVEKARQSFQQAIRLSNSAIGVPDLGHLYAISERRAEALEIAGTLQSDSSPPSYGLAILYAGLGDKELAFRWLERAHAERSAFNLMTLAVDPRLDPLRSDARFSNLLRRLHLPE